MPGRASPSAKRYARAAFELAQARGELDLWTEMLQEMTATAEHPEFTAMLEAPGVPAERKLAAVAQDGIAPAVRPAHTMGDGDTMFAIATGELEGGEPMGRLLAAVAVVTSRAITSGVRAAVGLAGLPAVSELTEARDG